MVLVTKTTMATVAKAASPLSGDCYGLESKITSAKLPAASCCVEDIRAQEGQGSPCLLQSQNAFATVAVTIVS